MRKAALGLLVLLCAACVKPSSRNSVWLVIKNETGANLTSVTLEHGKKDAFKYQLFTAGYTFGGWARVTGNQPLRLTYRNAAGDHQAPPLDKSLTPDMIGGRYIITLGPGGAIEQSFEPRSGPPPGGLARLEDYAPWLAGLVALCAVPLLVLGIRRGWKVAAGLQSAVANFFSNPAIDEGRKRFGLTYKECPVRMFSLDPARPASWWEGVHEGRMLDVLDPPLVRAVMRGDEAKALALIRSGAALNELTIGYMSALNAAATAGRAELVRALLEAAGAVSA